ncbi:hypothetical protein BDZ45DRAFT_726328 [Acephala macrosclerotiorum]|nr:hypothetical protein BDZ45DRAFT_726328 [Acephala macrosclerotiorum]
MNHNYDINQGSQRTWIATGVGNPSSLFPANWQTFGSLDWASEQAYLDAGRPGVANFPVVGVAQEDQNGPPRATIRELDIPTQSIRPESMGPPPSPPLALTHHPQAPGTAPNVAVPQKGRKRRPPESEWNKYKCKIKDLYMTRDLPLEDTMELMEKEHGFCPSMKMYKQKFKLWKWSKKLPRDTAEWMLRRAHNRRNPVSNEPKDTTFFWGNQVWTVDRVKQSVGRRNKVEDLAPQDGPTPSDIVVKTPISIVESPHLASSPVCSTPSGTPWAPNAIPSTAQPRNVAFLRLRWNNLEFADVQDLKHEAARLDKAGDTINAEIKFRDALSGFEALLSPTHEETTIAAYQFASFLANQDRMKEADRVLDWLGGNYIRRWGLQHRKTVSHLLRVIELLQSWERRDDAMLLLSRVLDSWDDMDSDLGPEIVAVSTNAVQDTELEGIDPDVAGQVFKESSDKVEVDSQLRVVSLWLSSSAEGLEPILVRLIQQCEKYPEKLRVQTLQARCSLAKLYLRLEQQDSAIAELEMAQKLLMEILAPNDDLHWSILKTSRQLAFAYVECNNIKSCDYILERVVERLEARLEDKQDQTAVLVIFLTEIAREYQRVLAWQNAAPWFERALAISLIGLGSEDERTQRLEAALQNQQYHAPADSFEDFDKLLKSRAQQFTIHLRD